MENELYRRLHWPGLGVSKATAALIDRLRQIDRLPVVVDADAITTCVNFGLFPLPESWILTPHAGELARILKQDARELEENRLAAAQAGVNRAGCHILFKGFRTVIANSKNV